MRSDLTLPRQNLPQTDIGLEDAEGIGPQRDIRGAIDGINHSEKAGDGSVVQAFEIRKKSGIGFRSGKTFQPASERSPDLIADPTGLALSIALSMR